MGPMREGICCLITLNDVHNCVINMYQMNRYEHEMEALTLFRALGYVSENKSNN